MTETGVLRIVGNTGRDAYSLSEADVRKSTVDGYWVLVTPSYKTGNIDNDTVPEAVRRFLSNAENRRKLVGVIGAGDRNFGEYFIAAARWVAEKSGRPILGTFEKTGTPEEIKYLREILDTLDREFYPVLDSEMRDPEYLVQHQYEVRDAAIDEIYTLLDKDTHDES